MSKAKKHISRAGLIVLAVVLFVAVNILSTSLLTSSRIDLTADRLYSLSDGTRNIVGKLDEPVTLRFFFSDQLATPYPSLKSYGERVRNLLQEYESLSGGKIKLVTVNPEPFSSAEDDAVAAGLRGVQTSGGETLYFGLVATSSTDLQQTIAYFAPERERYLEYDLSKLVSDLASADKPVVGLITTLPLEFGPGGPMAMAQGQSAPYVVYEQLRQSYTVRNLGPVFSSVGDDVDMLLIVHPGDLGEAELYAIDQYVLRGGKAIVFVDPHFESAAAMQQLAQMMPGGGVPASSNMKRLFTAWGVQFDSTKVLGDRTFAQRVSVPDMSGGRSLKDYIAWLALPAGAMNSGDIVTADLNAVNLASSGVLSPVDGASTTFEPLISSSAESMLLDVDSLRAHPDPDDLLRAFKADGAAKTIAARIGGKAKSAFATAPAAAPSEAGVAPETAAPKTMVPHLGEAQDGVHVIVVADVDLFEDQFWVQVQNFAGQRVAIPMADNGPLIINAVDNLSGSSDLIGLRSRGVSQRPFTLVDDIRRQAETRFLAEEQRLQSKLAETEQRIRAAEEGRDLGDAAALDRTQADAVESFRQELLTTRKDLRDVQHSLRRDIERLGSVVAFINIALVPILVGVAALIIAAIRRRRADRV